MLHNEQQKEHKNKTLTRRLANAIKNKKYAQGQCSGQYDKTKASKKSANSKTSLAQWRNKMFNKW